MAEFPFPGAFGVFILTRAPLVTAAPNPDLEMHAGLGWVLGRDRVNVSSF
jgi:hypothetical protein